MKRRRNNWNLKELLDSGSEAFRALNGDTLAQLQNPKPKRHERPTLDGKAEDQAGMVYIDCPVIVRITRIVPHTQTLDDDNLSGGCKELRDSIAAALGRSGDSEADGMFWEYAQEKGPEETRIEISTIDNPTR